MKFIILTALIIALSGCSSNGQEKDVFDNPIIEKKDDLSFEDRIKREVEAKLSIPVTEKYTIEIKKTHLNNDDKEDAIITVNRLNFAIDEAAKEVNPTKRAELGYMGNYNYFFFYDGKLEKVSVPVLVASSAKAPLEIKFENIQSEFYQDVCIEYRIRNSKFRNYYLLENGVIQLIFQWKLFDLVGTADYEANFIEYQEGSISLAKDILIYKGKIENYSTKIDDIYSYNPTIEKNQEVIYRFFYDPKTMKYMTKNLK
jgi:hypothetical protein